MTKPGCMRCFYSHRNRHECLAKRVTSVTASAASVVESVTSVAESVTSDAESVAASVTSVAKTAHDCCCAHDCNVVEKITAQTWDVGSCTRFVLPVVYK